MKIISDDRLLALGIVSGTVTRHSGTGRNPENVKKVLEGLNIDSSKVLGLHQVHGTDIINLITDEDAAAYKEKQTHDADAWLLGKKGYGGLILTADCVPLFIWDDKGSFVGLAHCGWRGVAGGLPAKMAREVKARAGAAARLCAFIGPHIRPCCFEVKEDVSGQFSPSSVIRRDGKIFVDLTNEIILQLKAEGLAEEDIKKESILHCTCCVRPEFFSYRRDKTKDVLISFAYKL